MEVLKEPEWVRPQASLDEIQQRDNWGRIFARSNSGVKKRMIHENRTKIAIYDDTAIKYSVKARTTSQGEILSEQKAVRAPSQIHGEDDFSDDNSHFKIPYFPDDQDLYSIKIAKLYLPYHVKMLRPPQPKPMTRSEQAALLITRTEVSIHDYKSSATILDIAGLNASIRAGLCTAVRPTAVFVAVSYLGRLARLSKPAEHPTSEPACAGHCPPRAQPPMMPASREGRRATYPRHRPGAPRGIPRQPPPRRPRRPPSR